MTCNSSMYVVTVVSLLSVALGCRSAPVDRPEPTSEQRTEQSSARSSENGPQLIRDQDREPCEVHILEPRTNQLVSTKFIVKGTATLPAEHQLWVFARPGEGKYRPRKKWWLQEGPVWADPATGQWHQTANFGCPGKNLDQEFDVTAAVFAPAEGADLERDLERFEQTDFEAMSMPPATCVSATVTVRKILQEEPGECS